MIASTRVLMWWMVAVMMMLAIVAMVAMVVMGSKVMVTVMASMLVELTVKVNRTVDCGETCILLQIFMYIVTQYAVYMRRCGFVLMAYCTPVSRPVPVRTFSW